MVDRGRPWEFTAVDAGKTPPDMLGYLRGTNILGFIWFYVPRIPENFEILILMMDINMGTKNLTGFLVHKTPIFGIFYVPRIPSLGYLFELWDSWDSPLMGLFWKILGCFTGGS